MHIYLMLSYLTVKIKRADKKNQVYTYTQCSKSIIKNLGQPHSIRITIADNSVHLRLHCNSTDTTEMARDVCNYGDIRLVGGSFDNEGRVELCINNSWDTICDDSRGSDDANVVCTQLGYLSTGEKT